MTLSSPLEVHGVTSTSPLKGTPPTRTQPGEDIENHPPTNNANANAHTNTNKSTNHNHRIEYAVSTRWEREQEEYANGTKTRPIFTGTIDDCNKIFCPCAKRQLGNMVVICESYHTTSTTSTNGERVRVPSMIAGPYWPFCMFFTVPLIVSLSGLTLYYCILSEDAKLPTWFAYIYCPLILMTLISLFMTSCRDPGLRPRLHTNTNIYNTQQPPQQENQYQDEEEDTTSFIWNEQVASYRPPNAMYCKECKVLIDGYDHLCPWTGTGIGKKNMCCFKIFVILVNLLCYGSVGIVVYISLS